MPQGPSCEHAMDDGENDERRVEDSERDEKQQQQRMREAALCELLAKASAWLRHLSAG